MEASCWVGVVWPLSTELHGYIFLLSHKWGLQVENSTICTSCNCVTSDDCASDCQRRVLKSICSPAALFLRLFVCRTVSVL